MINEVMPLFLHAPHEVGELGGEVAREAEADAKMTGANGGDTFVGGRSLG